MARMGRRPVIRFFLLMSASTKMVMMVMRRIPMLLLLLGMLVLLVLLVVKGTNLAFLELGVPKFQESVIWGEAAGWFWLNILLSAAVRVRLPSDVPRWLLTFRFFTSRHTAVCQNMLGFLSFADCKHHLQLWTSGWFLENDSTRWKLILPPRRWLGCRWSDGNLSVKLREWTPTATMSVQMRNHSPSRQC